jgi:hypothetical protein
MARWVTPHLTRAGPDLALVAMALLPLRRYPGRLRSAQTDAACPAACCGYLAGITNDTHCPWFLNGSP